MRLAGAWWRQIAPGRYRLRWDLVREQVTWFSERGSSTGRSDGGGAAGRRRERLARGRPTRCCLEPGGLARPRAQPSRAELWRAASRLWRQHPMLGVGPDNFRRRYPEVIAPAAAPAQRFEDERLHANNFYLETLAGLGVAGVLALAALLWALGGPCAVARRHRRRDWREFGDKPGDSTGALLAVACAVAAASFFVHGMLDYFLEFTADLCSVLAAAGAGSGALAVAGPAESHQARGCEGQLRRPPWPRPRPAPPKRGMASRLSGEVEHQHRAAKTRFSLSQIAGDEEVGQPEVQVEQRHAERQHRQRRRRRARTRRRTARR